MTINVTQRHIDQGERGNCSRYPVVHALLENSEDEAVKVDCGEILFNGRCYAQPREVRRFVGAFDAGRVVRPFSFELPVQP